VGASLIQAQRDYFGAHTYEKNNLRRGEFHRTDWIDSGAFARSGSYSAWGFTA
jgi:6-phosphogluconate dehydrogenase